MAFAASDSDRKSVSVSVSVVIPTRGRPDLVLRAVSSVLAQSVPPSEVLVIVDGPDRATTTRLRDLGDPRVRVHELATSGGAARARNTGVSKASSELIAFLDDDDEWLPSKLELQLDRASSISSSRFVLGTGVEWRGAAGIDVWPVRPPAHGEKVADYLFVRRTPGEGLISMSTVLIPRDLALEIPLPEGLVTHEEWDWFIELEKHSTVFDVELAPLVVVHAPALRHSISSSASWEASLGWALSRKHDVSPRAFSAFCLTEVARGVRQKPRATTLLAIFLIAWSGALTPRDLVKFIVLITMPERARWLIRRCLARRGTAPVLRGTA
jgi:hypothetical protein